MKRMTIAALAAAQLLGAAGPASAADLVSAEETRAGAFGGLRISVPIDGVRRDVRPIRAGLTIAPTLQARNLQGETRTLIGQGFELGIAGRGPVTLSLAGTRLDRLGAAQDETEDEDEGGISTLAIVGIGAAVLIGVVAASFQLCVDGEICGEE